MGWEPNLHIQQMFHMAPKRGVEDVRSELGFSAAIKEKKGWGRILGSNGFHSRPGQLEAMPEKPGVSACLLLTQGHLLPMQHHWEQALLALCSALRCSSHGPTPCPVLTPVHRKDLGKSCYISGFPPVKWGWRGW